jgi:tripartite-type tricarboxylate transporter receptor subunit TctC
MKKQWRDSDRTRSMDRRSFLVLASTVAATLVAPRASAQSAAFPTRPISIVVAYTPGAAPDILARLVASELPAYLGQNAIVDNKPGAGGSIGTAAVARAKNDGYTLCLVSTSAIGINPAIYRNLPYDPIKDFTPIIKLARSPNLLVVPAQSPATSVQDLIKRMKERGKENAFRYNSIGNGTTQHLAGALFVKKAGAYADHVPYRSVPDQMTALVTGQVDFGFATLASSGSFVKGGRVRALGITAPSALLPEVPSLLSTGLEGFDKTDVWFGVVAPKDTPDAVVQTLHRAFVETLGNTNIQAKLSAAGYDPAPPASSGEFALFIRDQEIGRAHV